MPTFRPGWNRFPWGRLIVRRVVTVLVHAIIFCTFGHQILVAALWSEGVRLWRLLHKWKKHVIRLYCDDFFIFVMFNKKLSDI